MSKMAEGKDRSVAAMLHSRGLGNRGVHDLVRNTAVASIQTV